MSATTLRRFVAAGIAAMVLSALSVSAQMNPDDRGPEINRTVKAEIIDSLTEALNLYYVFPEVASQMEQHARAQLKSGAYDTLTTVGDFAMALTEDLRTVCHDRHFGLQFVPREMLEARLDTANRPTVEAQLRQERARNFGFEEVKRLPGNIGYLKFNGFSSSLEARETAIAAMNFLANSDALIIDLRENGGGDPIMIGLISSYFFDQPVHLNSFYIRATDSLQQFWTSPYVDGKRMSKTPIYILTSHYSFSGAEEFTYNLKNLKRATVVGETTGGGAHPVDEHVFPNLQISARIPFGRAINPITGTNWEGTGVPPDIECPAEQALDVARLEAVKYLRDHATDPRLAAEYDWAAGNLRALLDPADLSESQMLAFAGAYGPRIVTAESGALYYQREGNPRMIMTYMGDDTFCFEEIPYFRVKFLRDDFGTVTALEGQYDNGRRDRNDRTS